MEMKQRVRIIMVATCMVLAPVSSAARAAEIPLVTGEHWTQSNEQQKRAYLIGIANVVQVEAAYGRTSPASDSQSVVPRMNKGLDGQTLDSVREALDKWYAANPSRQQRPVIETLWFELVAPGLQKAK